jgi:hypothetical protein
MPGQLVWLQLPRASRMSALRDDQGTPFSLYRPAA